MEGEGGGEPSRLKICQWLEREKWMSKSQVENGEKEHLVKMGLHIMYQTGKGNKLVPCLVPPDCVLALDKLCDHDIRKDAGVSSRNAYIFANTEGSEEHVSGWDTVHYMCRDANINNPSINATNNRGRISTMYAALELSPEDRPYFYSHMGHSGDVNAGTYQRPLPIQELLKVGKHLISFDEGQGTLKSVG